MVDERRSGRSVAQHIISRPPHQIAAREERHRIDIINRMKKTKLAKRLPLKLDKDTVRLLSTQNLDVVAGGLPSSNDFTVCSRCPTICVNL